MMPSRTGLVTGSCFAFFSASSNLRDFDLD